jgi:hypothetical protein
MQFAPSLLKKKQFPYFVLHKVRSEGFYLSNITETSEKQEVPGYEQFALGLTRLIWVMASSIIVGGLCQSNSTAALSFLLPGLILFVVFVTPIGAVLFSSGLTGILKDTRS